jgi:hypothetical protein
MFPIEFTTKNPTDFPTNPTFLPEFVERTPPAKTKSSKFPKYGSMSEPPRESTWLQTSEGQNTLFDE